MIYNYPFFGVPNYLNYNLNSPNQYVGKKNLSQVSSYHTNTNKNSHSNINNLNANRTDIPKYFKTPNRVQSNTSRETTNIGSIQNKKREDEDPLFNFGGIPLYFDDVLLICLILFLYNEKIDDYYLLLALVLLLLG